MDMLGIWAWHKYVCIKIEVYSLFSYILRPNVHIQQCETNSTQQNYVFSHSSSCPCIRVHENSTKSFILPSHFTLRPLPSFILSCSTTLWQLGTLSCHSEFYVLCDDTTITMISNCRSIHQPESQRRPKMEVLSVGPSKGRLRKKGNNIRMKITVK